jgi:ribosomal protein L3
VKVDDERGLIMVKGAVPGHRNSLVLIHKEQ